MKLSKNPKFQRLGHFAFITRPVLQGARSMSNDTLKIDGIIFSAPLPLFLGVILRIIQLYTYWLYFILMNIYYFYYSGEIDTWREYYIGLPLNYELVNLCVRFIIAMMIFTCGQLIKRLIGLSIFLSTSLRDTMRIECGQCSFAI